MTTSVQRVSHIHLVVADVDRSARFYTRAFGFDPRYTSADGVVYLETATGDWLALEPANNHRVPGIDHFGLELTGSTTFDATMERVVAGGGAVLGRDEIAPGHTHAYVADPDGHVIQL